MKNKTLLLTLLTTTALGLTNVYASSGSCGDNCSWDLTSRVLTISGSGEMTNYSYGTGPWNNSRYSMDSVVIEGEKKDAQGNVTSTGITAIGDYAFYGLGCSSLTIPDTVTTIGNSAFSGAQYLTSLTIPDSVITIGNSAFSSIDNLTSLTIGNSVTTIGNSAFKGAEKLTSVTIPDSVTSIGNSAFYDTWKLESLTIGKSVTTIGDYAFYYAYHLTSLTIPDSVTSVGTQAFQNVNPTELTIGSAQLQKFKDAGGGFSNITAIHCIDGEDACKEKLTALGLTSLLDYVDTYTPPAQTSGTGNSEDSGATGGRTARRIYTIEEANAVAKPTGNRVRLKYR